MTVAKGTGQQSPATEKMEECLDYLQELVRREFYANLFHTRVETKLSQPQWLPKKLDHRLRAVAKAIVQEST